MPLSIDGSVPYAHVSEASFRETAQAPIDKLIDMGFTDEEVRESLKPRGVEQNDQGELFNWDPVRPKPVLQFTVPNSEYDRRVEEPSLAALRRELTNGSAPS